MRIEVSRRFVGQDQFGIGNYRARNRDTLFLTAGQLPGIVGETFLQADERERRFHMFFAFGLAQSGQHQRQFDILECRQHGNEVEGLKNKSHGVIAPGRNSRSRNCDMSVSPTMI